MFKRFSFALAVIVLTAPSWAQTVSFQNGVTELIGGGFYEGTDDTEFRSAEPGLNEPQGENLTISVDGDDGGNVTQGAIRFGNLLVSQGGLVPDQVATGAFPITNATLTLYSRSGTADDANIEFHRVVGVDNETGGFWQEDDTFNDLTDNVIPLPGFRLLEYPFNGQFDDNNDGRFKGSLGVEPEVEIGPERDFAVPTEQELADSIPDTPENEFARIKHTDSDSENLLDFLRPQVIPEPDPDTGITPPPTLTAIQALEFSLFEFDVTDAVVDWLVNGEPNQGWAITNNTGDGWDFNSSEGEGELDESFLNGETIIPGMDTDASDGLDPLPFGLLYALGDDDEDPNTPDNPVGLLIDQKFIRPKLTVTFQGGNGPADLNFDQEVDELDLQVFLDNFGLDIDSGGIIPLGTAGDLDFDRDIDPEDWLIFKREFDLANGPGALAAVLSGAAAVPEPASAVLLVLAGLGVAFRSRLSGDSSSK